MKRTAFVFALISVLATAQCQNWTWTNGSNDIHQPGSYGVKGVAAPTNNPGSRDAAFASATSTHLYLFGGSGYAANPSMYGPLNDLWRYEIATGQWTWIGGRDTANQYAIYGTQGVSSASAMPAGRATGASFTDAAGNFWIFGGMGYAESNHGVNNDLWKYTVSTGQWTWMKGSKTPYQNGLYGTKGIAAAANRPGARYEQSYTTDAAGNFWIFGGVGRGATGGTEGPLNDLWKYNAATNQWTWVSGGNDINFPTIYGTKGVPSTANYPGGRSNAACWFDAAGNFWLFGGFGVEVSGLYAGHLNELWRFTPSTGEWTWMGGINTMNTPGIYGTQGVASAANFPGARSRFTWFTDEAGCFWLFGGWGFGEAITPRDYLNDLWMFDPVTLQWTWVKGSKFSNAPPSTSGLNTTTPSNTPAGRQLCADWYVNGKLYLFGGSGYANNLSLGHLNDTWNYGVYTQYRFTGTGDWDNSAAWENGIKPPAVIPAGNMVIIQPSAGGDCVISGSVSFQKGARLVVPSGRTLRVTGQLSLP